MTAPSRAGTWCPASISACASRAPDCHPSPAGHHSSVADLPIPAATGPLRFTSNILPGRRNYHRPGFDLPAGKSRSRRRTLSINGLSGKGPAQRGVAGLDSPSAAGQRICLDRRNAHLSYRRAYRPAIRHVLRNARRALVAAVPARRQRRAPIDPTSFVPSGVDVGARRGRSPHAASRRAGREGHAAARRRHRSLPLIEETGGRRGAGPASGPSTGILPTCRPVVRSTSLCRGDPGSRARRPARSDAWRGDAYRCSRRPGPGPGCAWSGPPSTLEAVWPLRRGAHRHHAPGGAAGR